VEAFLRGIREVPSVSTHATGRFEARIDGKAGTITYELAFFGLTGDVQQAHIHFGQRSVNGGISVFLCQTEASPDPTGLAPHCPKSGKVTGVLQSANMIEGPIVGQGIEPGEFNELIAAIRAGVAYVNVHSSTFSGGEVRGQIRDAAALRDDLTTAR
jgi:hypothetical protein